MDFLNLIYLLLNKVAQQQGSCLRSLYMFIARSKIDNKGGSTLEQSRF